MTFGHCHQQHICLSWQHDSGLQCTPGESSNQAQKEMGNYIMYARATSGDKINNNKFSMCSIGNMSAVLAVKKNDCFVGKSLHFRCLSTCFMLLCHFLSPHSLPASPEHRSHFDSSFKSHYCVIWQCKRPNYQEKQGGCAVVILVLYKLHFNWLVKSENYLVEIWSVNIFFTKRGTFIVAAPRKSI